ncbi:uncharacterized protein C10orf120 homolog [Mirounga angustirostris]|uniref:uncharacterized protein C10orf120 homolog n=1 Tax=Mirounga angustirostris TaxID=9716 RepID=UPI001E687565|nr:uncharacterized protein LOC123846922 [Mirounga angustirostris]XP_054364414.1 uncharacterized protein LOC123846922 [Mirounga angustirostris]
MLFAKLAMDRTLAEKNRTEDAQHKATRGVAPGAGRGGCEGSPGKDRMAARTPPSRCPPVTDSEWLDLSAEEQLAWARNTQDPRIAVGSQSPIEKKIKSLGGVHSSKVRKFLLQKSQQENETLHQLQAVSFDFRFAEAEAYYCRQHQQMMLGDAWRSLMVPRREIKRERERPRREKTGDAERWDYLVPERELGHIEKHIYRAERARGLRDPKYRLLPQKIPSETVFPNILTLGKEEKTETIQKTHKTKTKKHRAAWAKEQIKGHQDRMIRGRELTEQRNERLRAWKISAPTPLHRPATHQEEEKEFKRITAYPIA